MGKETIKPEKKGEKPITFKKDGLHESTKTPAGEKIPAKKMSAALEGKDGKKAEKQANFAKNVLTGPKRSTSDGYMVKHKAKK